MEDLTCTHDGSGSYYMYWYQQKAGGGLVLIAMSVAAGDATPESTGFTDSWEMSRPSNEKSVLSHLKTVEKEDSAMYYCAGALPPCSLPYTANSLPSIYWKSILDFLSGRRTGGSTSIYLRNGICFKENCSKLSSLVSLMYCSF
uniref:Ig-like domain-containing protein n=1 Tax=Leptobrachium leishanense TaxID=445787 RepID=A0A8C5PRR8_9ANUR